MERSIAYALDPNLPETRSFAGQLALSKRKLFAAGLLIAAGQESPQLKPFRAVGSSRRTGRSAFLNEQPLSESRKGSVNNRMGLTDAVMSERISASR
jgi:hypothetical protein